MSQMSYLTKVRFVDNNMALENALPSAAMANQRLCHPLNPNPNWTSDCSFCIRHGHRTKSDFLPDYANYCNARVQEARSIRSNSKPSKYAIECKSRRRLRVHTKSGSSGRSVLA